MHKIQRIEAVLNVFCEILCRTNLWENILYNMLVIAYNLVERVWLEVVPRFNVQVFTKRKAT